MEHDSDTARCVPKMWFTLVIKQSIDFSLYVFKVV